MKRPDVYITGRADVAAVTLRASRPSLPDVGLELTPRAARELIRILELATSVAEGNPTDTRRNADGEAVSWSEAVGASLAAFTPTGGIR